MGKTPCCNEEGLKKGAWTADEDHKLMAYIQQHGEGGWRTLPQKAGLQRCGKSCRLRWANYLRPGIKRGDFSTEEEQKIIELHAALGNRWSAIARHLPKRTDNEIKNYWNTHIKKRLGEMGIDPVTHMQINSSPTSSSNNNSSNHLIEENTNVDSDIRPIQRPLSASAKLLNKVSAKFALLHREDVTSPSTPSRNSLDAIKAVLINSTKDSVAHTSGSHGGYDSGNGSDVEILTSMPISSEDKSSSKKSKSSSQILNKMATKLAPSKSFDLLKNRIGSSLTNSTNENVTSSSNNESGYNTRSPISMSEFSESMPATSSAYESSELYGNVYMEENEVNEAFAALHCAIGLEDCPTGAPPLMPSYEYVRNYGAEDRTEDCQLGIGVETGFNNFYENSDFIERFTNLPSGGSPNNDYTNINYCYGDGGESCGEASEVNLNYWSQDFDLLNYAVQ